MASMKTQWVYIDNKNYGRLFAAEQDIKGNDHVVETNPNNGTGTKYWWKIWQTSSGDYYIQNWEYGFMFTADKDMSGNDHIVECNPYITTLDQVVQANDTKYLWGIQDQGNGYYCIQNKKYGGMFSADGDKKDNDHIVEARPGSKDTGEKWLWKLQPITVDWIANDWMAKLSEDKLLSELSIPGTHDSCALYDWYKEVLGKKIGTTYNAKCQNWDLKAQLLAGVRCLDVRLKKIYGNTLQAWHGDDPNFNVDQRINFDSIVEICKIFLSKFDRETIIMFIKKEDGDNIGSLIQQRNDSDQELWYTKNAIPSLKDVRGKIVLLRRFDGSPIGIDLFKNWENNDPDFRIPPKTEAQEKNEEIFLIQDKYYCGGDKEAAKKEKWSVVESMLSKCNADSSSKHWYINFASGYYKVTYNPVKRLTDVLEIDIDTDVPDVAVISNAINPQLASYLPTINNKCGTLMVDFINDDIIQKIIRLNK